MLLDVPPSSAEQATLDPLTRLFGISERTSEPGGLDLSLGGLHGVPELDRLTDGLDARELLRDIGSYPGTQGSNELRSRFSDLCDLEGLGPLPIESFVATHGALDGLAHALRASRTHRVYFPVPGFDVGIAARRLGIEASPLSWPVKASVSMLVDAIEDALLSEDSGAAVVVNFPANPSGAEPTDGEWERLIEVTARNRATLIVDDVYRFTAPSGFRPWLTEPHVVMVDSVSKRLGLPGLRLGYVATHGPMLAAIRSSVAETSVGVSRAVANIGSSVLTRYCESTSISTAVTRALAYRRDSIRGGASTRLLADLLLPPAGLYICLLVDSESSERHIVEFLGARGLRVAPSSALGAGGRQQFFIRICLGSSVDPDRVVDGLNAAVESISVGPFGADTGGSQR